MILRGLALSACKSGPSRHWWIDTDEVFHPVDNYRFYGDRYARRLDIPLRLGTPGPRSNTLGLDVEFFRIETIAALFGDVLRPAAFDANLHERPL